MKKCSSCENDKPLYEFRAHRKRGKESHRTECKECEQKYWAGRRGRAGHTRKYKGYMLMWKYGLTLEQYDAILAQQNGCCWICLKPAEHFRRKLAVDHLHRPPYSIRGLLCNTCNRYVVGRQTNPEIFDRAAAYLRQETGYFAPPPRPKRKKKV